jgi:hypothetical protein
MTYLLYRKDRMGVSRPFAIDNSPEYTEKMSTFDGHGYLEMPYEQAHEIYNKRLNVTELMKD